MEMITLTTICPRAPEMEIFEVSKETGKRIRPQLWPSLCIASSTVCSTAAIFPR